MLTEAALAHRGPVLVAPAMNHRMWSHAATQANVRTLAERGVELIGPEEGELAEGESGTGRMSEPEDIFRRVTQLLAPPDLAGRTRPRLGGRHARAARRRPFRRQPLLRPDGRRARRGGAPPRRPRHAARGEPRRRAAARRRGRRDADRASAPARGAGPRGRRPRPHVRRGRRLPAGRRLGDEAREGRRAVDDPARADRGRGQDAGRPAGERPGDRRLRRRARRERPRAEARDAHGQERRSRRLQRCVQIRHRLRREGQRGGPDHAQGGEAHRQGAEVADRGRGARRGGRAAQWTEH